MCTCIFNIFIQNNLSGIIYSIFYNYSRYSEYFFINIYRKKKLKFVCHTHIAKVKYLKKILSKIENDNINICLKITVLP